MYGECWTRAAELIKRHRGKLHKHSVGSEKWQKKSQIKNSEPVYDTRLILNNSEATHAQYQSELVYDRNLVSVSATKIKFRYQSLNFFYLNQNFLHFLVCKLSEFL